MKSIQGRRVRWIRVRVGMLTALLLVGVGIVVHRAWELQVKGAERLAQMAKEQHERSLRLAPKRGTIFDRNGAELAVSVEVDSVSANPQVVKKARLHPVTVAQYLASVLPGLDVPKIARRLSSDRRFVWVQRHVTPRQASAVKALRLPGIEMSREARRYYPNRELAAHVLGFANVDGRGIDGLELALDERLRGRIETMPATRDRRGSIVFSEQFLDDRATQGEDVVLTIDKTIQHRAEQELVAAVEQSRAKAGSLVVMDPHTGEVLAMANYPSFNPNDPSTFPVASRRNRAVTDRFEPGSTIKMFTMASALSLGTVSPNQRIDCGNGSFQIGEFVIHDSERWGRLLPAEILAYSSNVGISRIGMAMGKARMFRSLRQFGFGESTEVGFPGEASGILRHYSKWYDMDAATVPWGQGMSVTALQLAVATSALANGGKLLKPVLIRRLQNSHGEVTAEYPVAQVRRQAVAAWAARRVVPMLTHVTAPDGTGKEAAIEGYSVAGKTGTAQKADYITGGYARDTWLASFAGFVPADKPRLTIVTIIDEPTADHAGGIVAAPVFRRVGLAALRHLGVPAQAPSTALAEAHKERRLEEASSPRETSEQEMPGIVPASYVNARVHVHGGEPDGQVEVPYLVGKSARSALVMAYMKQLEVRLTGSGVVVAQRPEPGAYVMPGSRLMLQLETPLATPHQGGS